MSDRKRHGFVLLLVLGLMAASVAVIVTMPTRLGLDLKGGVELVYKGEPTAQQRQVTQAALQRAVQVMENRVNQLGVSQPEINTQSGDLIDVQLPDVTNVAEAERDVGDTARLGFYDWEANVLTPNGQTAVQGLKAGDSTATTLSQGGGTASASAGGMRLYDAVKLASQQPYNPHYNSANYGSEFYLFGAPGSSACKAWSSLSGKALATGQHCLIAGPDQAPPSESYKDAVENLKSGLNSAETTGTQVLVVKQGTIVLQAAPNSFAHWPTFGSPNTYYYVLRDRVSLFGNEITNPEESTTQGGLPDVEFGFTGQGNTAFQRVTANLAQRGSLLSIGSENLVQHFAVALDNQLLTVPSVATGDTAGISGGAEISGNFTVTSATNLAQQLRLGALPIKLKEISNSTVSATLGKQALHQGLLAMAVGLLVVVLFLLVFYRVLGLIAVAGLAAYGLYFYALIKLIPITMTLAGIAGLILTIGVAADANIVIFERVKEEIRAGRSVRQGIATGYRKGLTAIIDANVVTIITAFILFVLATEDVKGFAFTLGIGTFVSLFTAVLATQAILMTLGDSKAIQSPSALGAAGGTKRRWNFDFMGRSKFFFTMSGVILLIGALAIGARGLNLGQDFEGGTQITVGLHQPAPLTELKSLVASDGGGSVTVQAITSKGEGLGRNGYQISSKYLNQQDQAKLLNDLQNKYGIRGGINNANVSSVGPTFGSSVTKSAVIAIIISLLVISFYVALRFEWKFTVPVLIALMHDLLITAGVYALTGRVVTADTVAALLTILGYSLYDTIIVFDRVRENIPRMPRAAFSQIVNRSMSEVLTRSLATTSVTLLPIIALLLFGGSTLKDFAFALLIGVASGAYSSIFIASPVLMHWKEREQTYRNRRARITADLGHVPAYAEGTIGTDIEPVQKRTRSAANVTRPEAEGVSASEFEQMKRDLGLDEEPAGSRRKRGRGKATAEAEPEATPQAKKQPAATPQAKQQPAKAPEPAAQAPTDPDAPVAPAPDQAENDGVAQVKGGATGPRPPRSRNRKHGRR